MGEKLSKKVKEFPETATDQELFNLGARQDGSAQITYKEKGIIVGWAKKDFMSNTYHNIFSGYVHGFPKPQFF